jgi:hypothetical protein
MGVIVKWGQKLSPTNYIIKAIAGKKVANVVANPAGALGVSPSAALTPKPTTQTQYVTAGGDLAARGTSADDAYSRGYRSGLSGISRLAG